MHTIERSPGKLKFTSSLSNGARFGFIMAAALPFLAPYELLIKPDWSGETGTAWLLALIVSLGAMAIAAMLMLIGLFGLDQTVEFDTSDDAVHTIRTNLLLGPRRGLIHFDEIAMLNVVTHKWSDGADTHEIKLTPRLGKNFSFGNFDSQVDADAILTELRAMTEI